MSAVNNEIFESKQWAISWFCMNQIDHAALKSTPKIFFLALFYPVLLYLLLV